MFTDTSIATTGSINPAVYGFTKPVVQTAQELYQTYRQTAFSLIDVTNPQLFYRAHQNASDSYNGQAIHEKLIYQGMSVIDVSFGTLDYPWYAADANSANEITLDQLQTLANIELDINVSPRLRALATFAAYLPPYTRYYHYVGRDGVRAVTIDDEFNNLKLNCILTQRFLS